MKGNCTKIERYNGSSWDTIGKRVTITGPERMRETIEEDLVLDCEAGGDPWKQRSTGTRDLGTIEVETIWDPSVDNNDYNHHLFVVDHDAGNGALWRLTSPDDSAAGWIVHAFVETIGAPPYAPNQDVKVTVTLRTSGRFQVFEDDITANDLSTVPASIGTAPAPFE